MLVYSSGNEFKNTYKTVLALGNFDGFHIGHMHLLDKVCMYAKEHGLKGGVMFFDCNPKAVISNDISALQLTPVDYKLDILNKTDIDFVYLQHFTKEFAKLGYREFIEQIVLRLNPVHLIVGKDYKYGYKAKGNVDNLKKLGREFGFTVDIVEKIQLDGQDISASIVRDFVKKGDIQNVNRYLGREYFISGEVVEGLNNGEKMGFPTINTKFEEQLLIPANGVYLTAVEIDDREYKAVTNIGTRPTLAGETITVETHIINYSGDLYGRRITVRFKQRIRGEIHFDSIDELKEQISKDVNFAKNF